MEILADLKIAARGLWRSKGFAVASALTLALGIGSTTTIFSVVYGVLLRPLPYRDADRLVIIQGEKDFSSGPRIMNYSPIELEEFAAATSRFSSVAISGGAGLTLRSGDGVELINATTVSESFFAMLSVSPLAGRVLGDDQEPVVVISERLSRKLFGNPADAIDKVMRLADRDLVEHSYTVVGVMPSAFQLPRGFTDLWRPLGYVRSTGDDRVRERNRGGMEFIARLKDGATFADAVADASRANDALRTGFTNSRLDLRAKVTPLSEYLTGQIGSSLWILFGAVSLVLLVACTNVANLILARQSARAREVAMRMALGAPRGRLIVYMLAESGWIAAAGGLTGVGIAVGFIRVLQWLKPTQLPRLDAVAVDAPILLFAMAVAATAAIAAGLGPAVMTSRTDALLTMRAGSRGQSGGSRRIRSALVVIQIAASIVLLIGAALLARSLEAMLSTDLGVNTQNVIVAQFDMSLGRSVAGPQLTEMLTGVRGRVAAIPSVRVAGFGAGLPPNIEVQRISFVLTNSETGATDSHLVTMVAATPEYFNALQIRLVNGRMFNAGDAAGGTEVALVNREAARRLFGNDDPIGRSLPFGKIRFTIVGVVENVKYSGIAVPAEPVLYRPFAQQPFRFGTLVARTDGDPSLVAPRVSEAIRGFDPQINIVKVQPLTSFVSDAVTQPRFRVLLLSSIAVIALLLAMVGLYAVMAYSTAQRTSEIGVRMAIGAQRADVLRLVLAQGSRLALAGIIAGTIGAYWATQMLNAFLYQVAATDLVSFGGSAVAFLAIALIATYVPARRASRVDPMIALRTE